MHLQKKLPSFIVGSSGKVLVVPTPMRVQKKMARQVNVPMRHCFNNDEGIVT